MIDYGAVSPGWMGWEGARRERDGYLEVGDDFMFVMDINVESTLRPTDRLRVSIAFIYIQWPPSPLSLARSTPSLPPSTSPQLLQDRQKEQRLARARSLSCSDSECTYRKHVLRVVRLGQL